MYLMSLLKLLNVSFVSTYMSGSVLSRRGNQRRHNGLEATKKGLADILHPNPRVGAHSVLPHATEWTHESAPHTCFDREESTAAVVQLPAQLALDSRLVGEVSSAPTPDAARAIQPVLAHILPKHELGPAALLRAHQRRLAVEDAVEARDLDPV